MPCFFELNKTRSSSLINKPNSPFVFTLRRTLRALDSLNLCTKFIQWIHFPIVFSSLGFGARSSFVSREKSPETRVSPPEAETRLAVAQMITLSVQPPRYRFMLAGYIFYDRKYNIFNWYQSEILCISNEEERDRRLIGRWSVNGSKKFFKGDQESANAVKNVPEMDGPGSRRMQVPCNKRHWKFIGEAYIWQWMWLVVLDGRYEAVRKTAGRLHAYV